MNRFFTMMDLYNRYVRSRQVLFELCGGEVTYLGFDEWLAWYECRQNRFNSGA